MQKNFTLTYEARRDTRWLISDEEIARRLKVLADEIGLMASDGPQPIATVTPEAPQTVKVHVI